MRQWAQTMVDHARFHAIGGSIVRHEIRDHATELVRIFAGEKKDIVRGKPCLIAFFEDIDRVSADFGPRDLAPLDRAGSDFN